VWTEVIERIGLHGIQFTVLAEETTVEVTRYRMEDFSIGNSNREGRATASATPVPEMVTMTYRPGDIMISTDQPLGTLAVALLEPTGESIFFYWGFFNSQMVIHDYAENYIMVPIAEKLLSENEEIAAEWEAYKTDNPDYVNRTGDVLDWFS